MPADSEPLSDFIAREMFLFVEVSDVFPVEVIPQMANRTAQSKIVSMATYGTLGTAEGGGQLSQ